MSTPVQVTWAVHCGGDDSLQVQFCEESDGRRTGAVAVALAGGLTPTGLAKDHDWDMRIDCLCSLLMVGIAAGIIRTAQEFSTLAHAYLEHAANEEDDD
jgi:hypothetical protein